MHYMVPLLIAVCALGRDVRAQTTRFFIEKDAVRVDDDTPANGTLRFLEGTLLESGGTPVADPLVWEDLKNFSTVVLEQSPCVHTQCELPRLSDGTQRDIFGSAPDGPNYPPSSQQHCYVDYEQHGCPDMYVCDFQGQCVKRILYFFIADARDGGYPDARFNGLWLGSPAFEPMCETPNPDGSCPDWPSPGRGDICQASADARDIWGKLGIARNDNNSQIMQPFFVACHLFLEAAGLGDLSVINNPYVMDPNDNIIFDPGSGIGSSGAPAFPLSVYADGTSALPDITASGDFQFWSGCDSEGGLQNWDSCIAGDPFNAMCLAGPGPPGWASPAPSNTGITGDLRKIAYADTLADGWWEWSGPSSVCSTCDTLHWWICMMVSLSDTDDPAYNIVWDGVDPPPP